MAVFDKMIDDLKRIVKGAGDGTSNKAVIDARLASLKSLHISLNLQWRKLEAEWKRASSVEANLNKTPLMRVQSIRRAKSIARRMSLIGKFNNMVETFIVSLNQAQDMREHVEQMKACMGDTEEFKALGEKMTRLMAKNKEVLDGFSKMQQHFDESAKEMDVSFQSAEEIEENERLNELYERLETCQAKGDVEGAKAVENQIKAYMAGGSSLVTA